MTVKTKANQAEGRPPVDDNQGKVSFFHAWCKSCGNCVAFCPRKALKMDQWNKPYLADPDRCVTCGLCSMLCPDFAISVYSGGSGGEAGPPPGSRVASSPAERGAPVATSPERLAPAGSHLENVPTPDSQAADSEEAKDAQDRQ